jgi:hypothetical protein
LGGPAAPAAEEVWEKLPAGMMGRLQPLAVNPDGRPWAYRIIDPRQFVFSATFSL